MQFCLFCYFLGDSAVEGPSRLILGQVLRLKSALPPGTSTNRNPLGVGIAESQLSTVAVSLIETPFDWTNEVVAEAVLEPHSVVTVRLAAIPFAPDGTPPLPLIGQPAADPLPMLTPFCNQVQEAMAVALLQSRVHANEDCAATAGTANKPTARTKNRPRIVFTILFHLHLFP